MDLPLDERVHEGGCLCGATRFRVSGAPSHRCICHCRSCRLAAGAPFVAWVTFPSQRFEMLRGELTECRSSEQALRGFCGACGSSVTYAHRARPGEIDVALAVLDDAAGLEPQFHLWTSHKLPWVRLADGLPEYPEWRGSGA